ncbi:hypothetical protein VZT92_023066 [Zoarces viviparus]|uniref:Uncharacterized protein n=1 Tax=Zoarces viviparus TaxID=48416 RepID=A0AAW1E668_ZOAVI
MWLADLRRVFVVQMSPPTNTQKSPRIPVAERQTRNTAQSDNLAGPGCTLSERLWSSFTIYESCLVVSLRFPPAAHSGTPAMFTASLSYCQEWAGNTE